ncbi:hypothetical protein IHQ68_04465 [Chelatococcus sambhunathii]|uniref:Uncharacterized protein n=1 Tax=Chelatococcus sambhunathii TaxID=363953 RepID=A0ABU1DCN7_9HYPH|nr:hypothetical protein [Chelatococcus sambhunathii]MDR4305879.1 hypothetical protein [Chelatococcus sambhunathii]
MTRLHRHPVASLLGRCRLGTLSAARIVREIAAPDAGARGLGLMSVAELADEIAARWRSIHRDEDAVLIVERDRRGACWRSRFRECGREHRGS